MGEEEEQKEERVGRRRVGEREVCGILSQIMDSSPYNRAILSEGTNSG